MRYRHSWSGCGCADNVVSMIPPSAEWPARDLTQTISDFYRTRDRKGVLMSSRNSFNTPKTFEVFETLEVSNVFKDTQIGPIPVDWEVVRLGTLARVKYGKAKPKNEGVIPVVGSGGIYGWVAEALIQGMFSDTNHVE